MLLRVCGFECWTLHLRRTLQETTSRLDAELARLNHDTQDFRCHP